MTQSQTARELEPTNNGSCASAREHFPPSEKQEPNQSVQLTTQEAFAAHARKGERLPSGVLSPELFLILRGEADNSCRLYLGGIINEVTEYLLERQKLTPHPIPLEQEYIRVWAARFWGVARRAAVSYAGDLGQAVGLRKGLGPGDIRWILREVGAFFRQQFLGDKTANFLTESLKGVAEIQAPQVADSCFQAALTRYAKAPLLMRLVREELSKAQELYGRTKKSAFKLGSVEPAPSEMLANPAVFPFMSAKQVSELIPVSRSTVDAWANNGTLVRVGPEKKPGKRARLLVSTESVRGLMDARKD